jgi:L-alanine-DL-glutamate epimerase-like enolase superfamily enzyme
MKVTEVKTIPLRLMYQRPFFWAHGVIDSAEVILVEVRTDEGVVGYGESMSSCRAAAVETLLQEAGSLCVGRNPLQSTALVNDAYRHLFASRGTCSAPRFGAQTLAGLDMALWDIAGKAVGLPVHQLLGGPVREYVQYFGFPQGDSAEEVAREARAYSDNGFEVIYVKVGRGETLDLDIVQRVRNAIGQRRLRVDANEAWDILTASRMIEKLSTFDIEFVEQPTRSGSLSALAQVKAMSRVPIAADQIAFTPDDVYNICREQAADLVVLGLHESGGIGRLCKAAAITEAAGLNICLHGLYETGITTCASNQVGSTLLNLDDGNQFMNHFLSDDIIDHPDLTLKRGRLPVLEGPGLGFTLDWDAVERARESYNRRN